MTQTLPQGLWSYLGFSLSLTFMRHIYHSCDANDLNECMWVSSRTLVHAEEMQSTHINVYHHVKIIFEACHVNLVSALVKYK